MLNEICYYGNFKEYGYSSYDIRDYMDNVFKFYFFMTKSVDVPPNLRNYISNLDGKELVRFYHLMQEPLKFITNDDFMFFYLDHIIEHKFKDLSLELYLCYYMDSSYSDDVIKSDWLDTLSERYNKEIIELQNSLYQ